MKCAGERSPYPSVSYSVIHEKTWILDDIVMLTGSHNLTRHSARNNRENIVVNFDAHDVTRARARFGSLWEAGHACSVEESPVADRDLGKDSVGKSSHFGPSSRRRSSSRSRSSEPKEETKPRQRRGASAPPPSGLGSSTPGGDSVHGKKDTSSSRKSADKAKPKQHERPASLFLSDSQFDMD